MSDLIVKTYPENVLRKRAARVGSVTQAEKSILADMAKAMYLSQGVGLAAVQVGIDKQMAVIDVGDGIIKMIDPVINNREGFDVKEEGCLSCPNIFVNVKRSKSIAVSFTNECGDIIELKASGLLARVIQHELDHLSGRLIIDYLGPFKKLMAVKKLSSLKK